MRADFRVLKLSDPYDKGEWLTLWNRCPIREAQAHPEYAALFASPNAEILAVAFESETGAVLFPLIMRSIADEPWASQDVDLYDVACPYGYGGPFAWDIQPNEASLFWDSFREWADSSKVVSTFTRLPLFDELTISFGGEIQAVSKNVVRPLNTSVEEIWRDYAHKVRKNVGTAERAGLSVFFDESATHLDRFIEIYTSTLERREAREWYFFSEEVFRKMMKDLPLGAFLFHSVKDDQILASEIVLGSNKYLYSFLGGTLEEAFPLRANDLLKHKIIEWGALTGREAFVLGGGYAKDDGIFRYKKSFSPSVVIDFRVGQIIHDKKAYATLIDMRSHREPGWVPEGTFFPAYRG